MLIDLGIVIINFNFFKAHIEAKDIPVFPLVASITILFLLISPMNLDSNISNFIFYRKLIFLL
jgi:hypothetical protein